MKPSWTSAMTSFAWRESVPESQTPGPKLQYPRSSGGETGTMNTSGWLVKPAGTS